MSLDPSLKGANALIRHRNVLTRAERLDKLKEEEKWTEAKSVYGLPKVAHRKMAEVEAVKEEAPIDKRGCEISIRFSLDEDPSVNQIVPNVKVRHLDAELVRRPGEVQQAGLAF